ncbi:MAG: serine/threonine-protein phosphatase [Leptospira sp.]|nr:serine/threonine-protein phosphatase [Leptospira sp.]
MNHKISKLLIQILNVFVNLETIDNRSAEQLQGLLEKESLIVDKNYAKVGFYLHIIFYSWLFISPVSEIPGIAYYVLTISIFTLILLFVSKFERILSIYIYFHNFLLIAMIYLVFYQTYLKSRGDINFILLFYSFLSLLIIFQSLRLREYACIIVGLFLSFSYLIVIYIYIVIDKVQINSSIIFIPELIYILSIFIGTLIINSTRRVVKSSIQLVYERTLLENDLVLAGKVQDSLFPDYKDIKGIKFEIFRKTHGSVGGDFFDFVQLREGNIGVFLADVAGHGISAAMIAAILKVLVSTIPYRMKLNPAVLLDYLDAKLYKDFGSHHASAIYLFFDFIGKQIFLGNAGHPYPMFAYKDEVFQEVYTTGSILGYKIKTPVVDIKTIPLTSGSRLFLYTDGLIETPNAKGEMLEEEGLLEILNRNRSELNIKSFKESIVSDFKKYFANVEFSDDTMFLIIEID